jgi:hypothetical protein
VEQFLGSDVSNNPDEALMGVLEARLGALDATNPGWGDSLKRIFLVFDSQYGIRSADDSNERLLTSQARDLGIYFPGYVSRWLLVSYLEHLVPRFDAAPFIGVLQSRDADVAPPRTLSVEDCPQQLVYRWPTTSQPYRSFAEAWADHDVVHWGVCQPRNTLWVYYFRDGWREAQPNELALVCSEHGGSSPIAEFCQRAGINVR